MTAPHTDQRDAAAPRPVSTQEASGLLFAGFALLLLIEYIGLGNLVPILKVTRFSTLLAWGLMILAVSRLGFKVVGEHRQLRLLWYFVIFTGASVLWAVVQSYVPSNFRYMLDYFGLALITTWMMDRPARLKQLSVVFSVIILVLVFRNADKLTQSERVGVMLAGYFMGDGNDLAWGFVTMLLFPLYLLLGKHSIPLKGLGALAATAAVGGIIGTQSRGATLALGAGMLVYLLFVSKRKAVVVGAIALAVAVVFAVAPSTYFSRMKTLQNVEEDSSAQGRLRAWKAAVSMAMQWPLGVGAGSFNSAFGRYFQPTEQGWGMARWISAHSMYFKVLGEYGFLGLFLLLGILGTNFFEQLRMKREIAAEPELHWTPELWPGLLAMGMAGYSVAATFLGGVAYPHLFLLTGLTVACRRAITAARLAAAAVPATTAPRLALPAFSHADARGRTPVAAFIQRLHARHVTTAGRHR